DILGRVVDLFRPLAREVLPPQPREAGHWLAGNHASAIHWLLFALLRPRVADDAHRPAGALVLGSALGDPTRDDVPPLCAFAAIRATQQRRPRAADEYACLPRAIDGQLLSVTGRSGLSPAASPIRVRTALPPPTVSRGDAEVSRLPVRRRRGGRS